MLRCAHDDSHSGNILSAAKDLARNNALPASTLFIRWAAHVDERANSDRLLAS